MKPKDLMGAMLMDLHARHAKAAREDYDVDGLGYPAKPTSEPFCDMCPGTKAHNLSCPRAEYGPVVAQADAPLIPPGSPMDDDGWNQATAENYASVYGRDAAVETVGCLLSGPRPSLAVADVTDDEIVSAIARRFGLAGVREDDRGDLCDLGYELGLDGISDTVKESLVDRLDSIRCDARRLACHGQTLRPSEWGRRIAEALCVGRGADFHKVAATVTRILTGEREEASDGEG